MDPSLTLNAGTTSTRQTLPTSDVFSALAPGASCAALPSTSSRLWAIVRLNGTRIDSQPSLTINLGGARPNAAHGRHGPDRRRRPAGVVDRRRRAPPRIQGYQVLCSPGPSSPPAAAFDTCAGALPTGGAPTGPFASLDAALICSDLVGAGTHSVRVHGLQNGSTIRWRWFRSATTARPARRRRSPRRRRDRRWGSTTSTKKRAAPGWRGAQSGGGVGGGDARWLVTIVVGIVVVSSSGAGVVRLAGLLLGRGPAAWRSAPATPAPARDDDGFDGSRPALEAGVALGDPRSAARANRPAAGTWSCASGPTTPTSTASSPTAACRRVRSSEVFSSKKRLMAGLELDRHVAHWGGTWAVGFGAGYYKATASALAADHVTRTGDETSLRIVPLSLARRLPRRSAAQPAGLARWSPTPSSGSRCALWSASDTSAAARRPRAPTLGWNAAAGVSLDLSFLDPDSARTMDIETGINQFAIFFEVSRAALDGFGSSSVLRVGDTTWLGGLMLEM